ncbi:LOW QUALITY PROTEIN: beta-1,3-galactosyl-O-glycosyl-glycoprotein beta-1,6-N-acetylglucosaminyltransferase-like [Gigantopelta aegis]|uniref:LOW QUALITY PROTEIN: beta-1,3-galactosyl-O-glycosyl-glycoprotein beta-1,6-N-acetylglucosaminyltransferase-like n=1 Tax=Gigantopelta aegis TaxID=1735272 RepID=UPI001B88D8B7|nr:LOW QUALITY PROTEIN: beta-1,3-galactosyl-O-glycosyl-glycoprotein beta-1,6-N-acetylglucosaminyltransferase-like [Gigantopelta aegis]
MAIVLPLRLSRTFCYFLLFCVSGILLLNGTRFSELSSILKSLSRLHENASSNSEVRFSNTIFQHKDNFKEQQLQENSIIPQRDVTTVNCSGLIAGSKVTLQEVKKLMSNVKRPTIPDSYFLTAAKDCHAFRLKRGYILKTMTSEEENFPIAFSILMFKDVSQFERLLRAIYRPQNYYCIHVDKKASTNISAAVQGIANCFSNVFLTSRSVDVRWGTFTVLEPELICMQELWKYRKWKYFMNLAAQEFPLKTNLDMVRILKAYNGANDVRGISKR